MEWVVMSGLGILVVFTSIVIGMLVTVVEGYYCDNLYCCAVVVLEEGLWVVGWLFGVVVC